MKVGKSLGFLHYGIAVTIVLSGIFGYNLFVGDRHLFMPGKTTHGHHQIELKCDVCHVKSFAGPEPMQAACESCHAKELDKSRDTHPPKKFADPRNADLLVSLDATQCVTCHVEHAPEITGSFGVTMPEDFCFHCHQKIAEERPSHENFTFDSCSDSGCHNYHDNRALYEKFLAKHLDEPDLLASPKLRVPNAIAVWQKKNPALVPLSKVDMDGGEAASKNQDIIDAWSSSAHALAQVNCSACHQQESKPANSEHGKLVGDTSVELDQTSKRLYQLENESRLKVTACMNCHERHVESFTRGMHGMRVGAGLKPLEVSNARLTMQPDAATKSLTCASCHDPHQPDLKRAAVTSCQNCHNDQHTRNYDASPHAALWRKELSGETEEGSGVSCATCHMPRMKKGKTVYVEHNQNATLEPNSKMLRPVCLNCHGLEFSTAALADKHLIESNFNRTFTETHLSFELVRERLAEKKRRKSKKNTTN